MELVRVISKIGVRGARLVEESYDEQYRALSWLYPYVDTEEFLKAVVANALISYQLTGKAEEWWWEFARFMSSADDLMRGFERLLEEGKYNRRFTRVKIKKVRSVLSLLEDRDLLSFYPHMKGLYTLLTKGLGMKEGSKTVVFAVKMFGYAARIATGRFYPYPMDVDIPLDVRILRASHLQGAEEPREFWREVARMSNVPPLHIDSLVWNALRPDAENAYSLLLGEEGRKLVLLFKGKGD